MKKIRFIFVFIFLSGMIFTVFQYLPLLEEETPGHRIELAKKAKAENPADGDGDDTDEDCSDDDDSEKEYGEYHTGNHTIYFSKHSSSGFRACNFYKYSLENKNTPPPKA